MSEYLTAKDLQERFKISRGTVFNLMNAGKFPKALKLGAVYRWRLSDVEAFEKGGVF